TRFSRDWSSDVCSSDLFADQLMYLGFYMSTKAGISICLDDMVIPPEKQEILERAQQEVKEIEEQYASGLVTNGERYNKVVDIWRSEERRVGKERITSQD